MGGKAKPKKHTAAELAAKAKAANESVGGGTAGMAERDKKAGLKTECLEPGCAGTKISSLTVCKTHWSNKHCTCRRAPNPETGCCECFPMDKCKQHHGIKFVSRHSPLRLPFPMPSFMILISRSLLCPRIRAYANFAQMRPCSLRPRRLSRPTTTRPRRWRRTRTLQRPCAISSRRSRPPPPSSMPKSRRPRRSSSLQRRRDLA